MNFVRSSLIIPLIMGTCVSANANLVIDPTYDSSITSDPNAVAIEGTIQQSIDDIEADLENPITVTIDFEETNTGLGDSETYQGDISYSRYLGDLETRQVLSPDDVSNLAALGVSPPYTNPTKNPVNGSDIIVASIPLLRALGVSESPPAGKTDSTVQFNPAIVYDGTGTPPAGEFSLSSTVTHEIDEALGIGGGGSQLNAVAEGATTATSGVGPLDLDRYSGVGTRSYTTAVGPDPYFSINGGATNLVYFNQNGSTGSDFGDWGNGVTGSSSPNNPPKVQDAYAAPGSAPLLGPDELTALDVVGWNLTTQGLAAESAPEPEAFYLLLAGGLLMCSCRQLKSRRS